MYDPSTGQWTATGSLAESRADHAAVLLVDGRVLVSGGFGIRQGPLIGQVGVSNISSMEVYDPSNGIWSPAGHMSVRRHGHEAMSLPDNRVLIVGGASEGTATNAVEVFDPSSDTMSKTTYMMAGHSFSAVTPLQDGRILVAGGVTEGQMAAISEMYDPVSQEWSRTTGPPTQAHTATLLNDGKVLTAGGVFGSEAVALTKILDPTTGEWTSAGPMNVGRMSHSATLLHDGRVLAVGGTGTSGNLDSSEILDPYGGVDHGGHPRQASCWAHGHSTAGWKSAGCRRRRRHNRDIQPRNGEMDLQRPIAVCRPARRQGH